jgi:hypothetical protein
MPDQKFWQVYFALTGAHLPAVASTWKEGDPLPPISGTKEGDEDTFMSVTQLQGHLKTIGTKIQAAAAAATKGKVGLDGVELTSLLPVAGVGGVGTEGSNVSESGIAGVATNSETRGGALLEADPDLEAYLQTADEERQGGDFKDLENERAGSVEKQLQLSENGDGDNEDDDLDLDQYLNELSAEVGDAGGEIEGEEQGNDDGDVENDDDDDVEAVLRELQDEI